MFACLALPPSVAVDPGIEPDSLEAAARAFSPRVEVHSPRVVTLDVAGLRRLLGPPEVIAAELRRETSDRGCPAHVAVAATRTAAMLLALWRPGVTLAAAGEERRLIADLPLGVLRRFTAAAGEGLRPTREPATAARIFDLFERWGLRTLGDLVRLPDAALSARVGQDGLRWQRVARGEDVEPLVARPPDQPIEESLDLDWPIEGLEPLSFLLPRLLEPICDRLERLDQAAVTLHLAFRLATREEETRCLQLPAPMRDAKVLRTLILLHLESHPLPAGVDRLGIRVEPAPARIVQFSLLTRALPFPEQIATLVARLSALMGERRVGRPALIDSHRPGTFAMEPFTVGNGRDRGTGVGDRRGHSPLAPSLPPPVPRAVIRRFRLPVPARVMVQDGQPVRVTTERRGLEGGRVEAAAGPWRTSGEWWRVESWPGTTASSTENGRRVTEDTGGRGVAEPGGWSRDEWDVALGDGAVYRIYRDRASERWFVEGILD